MMSQFQLALENGLHGRVAPMVKQQCIIDWQPTPLPLLNRIDTGADIRISYSDEENTTDREYYEKNDEDVGGWNNEVATWNEPPINNDLSPTIPEHIWASEQRDNKYEPSTELKEAMKVY